jgi:2-keto-4-pentenoate hydratase
LRAALAAQLADWRRTLGVGAERVGWKLGIGDRESIGPGPVIGHLTSATQLDPGSTFHAAGAVALHADAEVALELGRAVDPSSDRASALEAIAGFGPALELVDLGGRPGDPASRDFGEAVRAVAALLGAMGERLEAGDRVITGSVVQLRVEPGDEVVAGLGQLGRVGLTVAD